MGALVSESQLSEALDIGPRAVRLKAIEDDWPSVKRPKQGGNELFYVRNLLPVKVRQALVGRQVTLPVLVHDTAVPNRSKKIGLAKYNLVHAFRVAKEQAEWGRKGAAAADFLLAYNAGVLIPNIFEVVREVQLKTLEALDKKLAKHDDNYLCLCDGRGGWKKHGTNSYKGRKLSERAKEVFLQCYLNPHQPSVKMAIRAAEMTLEKRDCPERANESTWRRWLKDYEKFNAGVICLARRGMKAYQDEYGPYIDRDDSLLEVGQCLVADGKILNFFIRHPVTGQPCRMTLIIFMDWRSRYPAGWYIMPTENQWGILSAFRNAVESLGKYPGSVYMDNGRAFKSKLFMHTDPDFSELCGIYARVGVPVFLAKPYGGRSKVVERLNGTIQSQLEWLMPSYCGDSIDTKPAWTHRNEKFHKAWHEARTNGWVPTIREAAVIIDRYFKWYAQQPHADLPATPEQMFMEGRGPGIDPLQLNYDFLWRVKVKTRRCRIRLWKIDYEGDFLHNLSKKIELYAAVNTADLRSIWCYTKEGIYLGEAYPVEACHPLARLFGDAVSVTQVMDENKRQAKLAKANKQQLAALGITESAEDSLNIFPFKAEQVAISTETGSAAKPVAEVREEMSEAEVKRLAQLVEKTEAEMAAEPDIPRPKYWKSELERYEWCFRLVHEHGRAVDADDQAFMEEFEDRKEFEGYRQRYEDLKLVFG